MNKIIDVISILAATNTNLPKFAKLTLIAAAESHASKVLYIAAKKIIDGPSDKQKTANEIMDWAQKIQVAEATGVKTALGILSKGDNSDD